MIRELEQIASDKDAMILHDIFRSPVLIEDCLIDSVKYSKGDFMIGGYIKKTVDIPQDGYMNGVYVYYWICFKGIRRVEITDSYAIQSFKIERKNDCVLLEATDGLKITADNVMLDSITPTWCNDLNSNFT